MLRARHIVGDASEQRKESVYDLSGMNRGSGITAEDMPHLTSHVPFSRASKARPSRYALKHMGADPRSTARSSSIAYRRPISSR